MVRKIYGKQPGDPMKDLNVNLAVWEMFMNATLRAAVHLRKDYDTNLRFVKKYLWKTTGQLFRETEKLITGQTETTGISLINFPDSRWASTSLLHNRDYQYSTAKVYVSPTLCSVWVQQMMGKLQCDPADFKGSINFMSLFNDIVWDAKRNDELCVNNSKTIQEYAERFPRGYWSFLGPGSEKTWYKTCSDKPNGN